MPKPFLSWPKAEEAWRKEKLKRDEVDAQREILPEEMEAFGQVTEEVRKLQERLLNYDVDDADYHVISGELSDTQRDALRELTLCISTEDKQVEFFDRDKLLGKIVEIYGDLGFQQNERSIAWQNTVKDLVRNLTGKDFWSEEDYSSYIREHEGKKEIDWDGVDAPGYNVFLIEGLTNAICERNLNMPRIRVEEMYQEERETEVELDHQIETMRQEVCQSAGELAEIQREEQRERGLVAELDGSIPAIIIRDIHARPDFIDRSLVEGAYLLGLIEELPEVEDEKGQAEAVKLIEDKLAVGELSVCCAGDYAHSEPEKKKRKEWVCSRYASHELHQEYGIPQKLCIREELDNYSRVLERLVFLKKIGEENTVLLRGNHDDVMYDRRQFEKDEREREREIMTKVGVVNQVAIFERVLGEEAIEMVDRMEKSFPMVAVARDANKATVVLHAKPEESLWSGSTDNPVEYLRNHTDPDVSVSGQVRDFFIWGAVYDKKRRTGPITPQTEEALASIAEGLFIKQGDLIVEAAHSNSDSRHMKFLPDRRFVEVVQQKFRSKGDTGVSVHKPEGFESIRHEIEIEKLEERLLGLTYEMDFNHDRIEEIPDFMNHLYSENGVMALTEIEGWQDSLEVEDTEYTQVYPEEEIDDKYGLFSSSGKLQKATITIEGQNIPIYRLTLFDEHELIYAYDPEHQIEAKLGEKE